MVPASSPQRWNDHEEAWKSAGSKHAAIAFGTALNQVKRSPQPASAHLGEPFETAELLPQGSVATILLEWRFFNPFGPSRNALFAAAIPDASERLLVQRIPPPQSSSTRIWGWLPSSDPRDMRPVVAALFRANGSPRMPLMNTLPTHVEPCGPFRSDEVKEFFWTAAQATRTCGLKRICDYLEWFRDNPFERAAAELRDALDGRKAAGPATRTEFERWWSLVTDPRHISIENMAIEETLRAQPNELASFLREALRSRPEVF
jgi:hypothetical protein